MIKHVQQSEVSGPVKVASVADYIVDRLAAEGIDHCFGVAGDYVFPICDAVDSSAKVKWIGCANELNASYAADGYARIRGAAMLVTTYGVGELSALNGVMGAKAERSLVFHVIAMPSYTILRLGLQKQAQKAIEALGCPFTTTLMEKCVIDEGHPQFAGMYDGALSDSKTREIVKGADLVLDLGGVNLNDMNTAAYSARLDLSRFITVGLDDVRIGDEVIASVRLADVLSELAKLKPSSPHYGPKPQGPAPVTGSPSDKITMAALYPRYAAFLRAGDTVVLETGSTSLGLTPTILPDGVRVEVQVLWGSIGWGDARRVRHRACWSGQAYGSDYRLRLPSPDPQRPPPHAPLRSN